GTAYTKCKDNHQNTHYCTFKDLEPGKTYTVRVKACLWGKYPEECSKDAQTPGWTKPNPPTSISMMSLTTAEITVEVKPPTLRNEIDSYLIQLNGDKTYKCIPKSLDNPVCEVPGLEAGTEYNASVKSCINEAPEDFCSEDVKGSTWTKPNPPQSVTVVAESTDSVVIHFKAPTVETGITDYEVLLEGRDEKPNCKKPSPKDYECPVPGLVAGSQYNVVVRSVIGNAKPVVYSEPIKVSGWTKTYPPRSVVVKSNTTTSVIVDVVAPEVVTGIGYYRVTVTGDKLMKLCEILLPGTLSCLIEDLKPGTEYTATVKACITGTDPAICNGEIKGSNYTRPNTPQSVTVVGESTTSLVVNFKAPVDNTGITYYELILDENPPEKIDSTQKLPHKIQGLEAGTQYIVKVRACIGTANPVVYSEDADMPGWTKPDAPNNVKVEKIYSRSFFVTWSKPDGNKDIKFFQAMAKEMVGEAAPIDEHMCRVEFPSSNLQCSVDGLSPTTNYSISVRACMPDGTCGAEAGSTYVTTCQDCPNYALIISLLVVFFVIIIVIILVFVLCKRRQWRSNAENYDKNDFPSDLKTIVDVKKN
uniref:Fibronectin type-III domain-containing protein n=1 Tax=Mesocestoides corti TaxID=53468 RepID=A0A5K3FDA2_MESCO